MSGMDAHKLIAPGASGPSHFGICGYGAAETATVLSDLFRKTCTAWPEWPLNGMNELRQVTDCANSLGYADNETETSFDSKDEGSPMIRRGRARTARPGAHRDKSEVFRALGRAEIDRNSAIGVYLKAN